MNIILNYEKEILRIAPELKELISIAKSLNSNAFMRPRTGWIRRNIQNPESIFEHSCKLSLASYYLFNSKEALHIAFIHDFAEIYEEDYIPWEISKELKRKKELKGFLKLKDQIPNFNYWFELWEKYEHRDYYGSYIYQLDKICPIIQSINYFKENSNYELNEFYINALPKIKDPQLNYLIKTLWNNKDTIKNAYESYFDELKKLSIQIIL